QGLGGIQVAGMSHVQQIEAAIAKDDGGTALAMFFQNRYQRVRVHENFVSHQCSALQEVIRLCGVVGLEFRQLLGIVDQAFNPPIDVVIQTGDLLAVGGGVEVLD